MQTRLQAENNPLEFVYVVAGFTLIELMLVLAVVAATVNVAGRCVPPAPYALGGSATFSAAIVELLLYEPDNNYRAFRVTVRGYGSTSRSTVLLQAYAVL